MKQLSRTIASYLAKLSWPMLPKYFFLAKTKHLHVALTRVCNANCVFCPYQFIEKEKRISMSDEIFDLVIDNIKKYAISSIMLSPDVGEPLLAPDFIGKMKVMRNAGVKTIECTTNGTLIHKIGINEMLEHGPDHINISTAGFDDDMYKRVYRLNSYMLMRTNVLELLRENSKQKQSKKINIWLRGDVDIHKLLNAPEMESVMELANEVCVMSEVDPWDGKIRQDMLTGSLKIQTTAPAITLRPCREIIEITVHPDGGLHVCPCRNMGQDPDLSLGNILNIDLFTAYHRLIQIYERWETGQIPSICRKCYMYNDPIDGILGQLKLLFSPVYTQNANKVNSISVF